MEFKIFITKEFGKIFDKLDPQIQKQIGREIGQLATNPYSGKPLGYKFFREKKVKGYRIYFLIYEEYLVVFIITVSGKKDQQEVINTIKALIPVYREEIKKRFRLSSKA
ncbi:type II toxin-antitoxin system RelE/ParE family toxin [Candidatus Woesearchaeota archaeon]|nr:type II toxin-antitoxin system RelE/ParE family toxin [Candidatus Woesearchaeota archaeon]